MNGMLHKSVVSLFSLLPYRFIEILNDNNNNEESISFLFYFHNFIKNDINLYKTKYNESMKKIRNFMHYTNNIIIPNYLKYGTLKNFKENIFNNNNNNNIINYKNH